MVVIFYLCCRKLHVRANRQALLEAANTTAKEFAQAQKIVEEEVPDVLEEVEKEGIAKGKKNRDKENAGPSEDDGEAKTLKENLAALVISDGIHSMVGILSPP